MRQEVKTREIRKYPTAIMVTDLMTLEECSFTHTLE